MLYIIYLLIPTSNHNAYAYSMIFEPVVYLLIPTSNHNWLWTLRALTTVVYLLIPTSNHNGWLPLYGINMLYIFWFLHQTTTLKGGKIKYYRLYIFWFLHQTTTSPRAYFLRSRCISFDSYIKPQPFPRIPRPEWVVYLLIPTSNHNAQSLAQRSKVLYIFWFLHQTITVKHQTTIFRCCISFDSYIKPQHGFMFPKFSKVVYLLIPTSNHNSRALPWKDLSVVYLLIPTSNHNWRGLRGCEEQLYIFWFLHQTTTVLRCALGRQSCISFDSYIKPQLKSYKTRNDRSCISFDSYIKPQQNLFAILLLFSCISFDSYIKPQLNMPPNKKRSVVYLLIPTSNHNGHDAPVGERLLYIFWFLHQTTTTPPATSDKVGLYIFWFLHQTTTDTPKRSAKSCCISFDSYIKPQPRLSRIY